MSQLLGKCVGLISGTEWQTVRATVEVPFTRKNATENLDIIHRWIKRHMAERWQHSRLSKGLLDPAEDLKMLPFWIVAEVFYGDLSPEQMETLQELAILREDLFKYVIHGGLTRFSFSHFLPTVANRKLAAFTKNWKAFNDQAYERALSMSKSSPIVKMYRLCKNGSITYEQLLHTLDESLFANLDVTTGGISWVLVFLAANPEYPRRLLDELETNLNHYQGDSKPYILSSSTLLSACVVESSRLRPLAAFSVPQSTPTPRIVDGYLIPAGTDFIVDAFGLNTRNKKFWGHDVASFRPERFLEHTKGSTDLRYQFWRFGFGPRQCMGRYIADFMIRALIVHIVEYYDISLLNDADCQDWNRHPDMWISHPNTTIRCVRKERRNTARTMNS